MLDSVRSAIEDLRNCLIINGNESGLDRLADLCRALGEGERHTDCGQTYPVMGPWSREATLTDLAAGKLRALHRSTDRAVREAERALAARADRERKEKAIQPLPFGR